MVEQETGIALAIIGFITIVLLAIDAISGFFNMVNGLLLECRFPKLFGFCGYPSMF